ncbi:MAG: gliding motility protein GldL [Prevotella sp.]|nr:gliding motility protein GldL [Prevotella sp.]
MTRYSKYNIIYLLQKWMDSVPGQTFLNYAYSWGASIVILGTLFKLTHLPGANLMLFIGMGTEVLVFFLSAFDRPFDKTADGMDLSTHYGETRQVGDEDGEIIGIDETDGGDGQSEIGIEGQEGGQVAAVYGNTGGTIIIGGGGGGVVDGTPVAAAVDGTNLPEGQVVGAGTPQGGATTTWVTQQQRVSPEMAEATENYVEELKRLTEMLGKVNEQSIRLTRDSEEMENLNRTLTGICKVYEMQLKGASQQIGTIDQINDQTKKMAQQIEQLNKIYARMIEAMTVNMRGATPAPPTQPTNLDI